MGIVADDENVVHGQKGICYMAKKVHFSGISGIMGQDFLKLFYKYEKKHIWNQKVKIPVPTPPKLPIF